MGRVKYYQATDQERARILDAIRTVIAGHPEITFGFLYGSFYSERLFRDIDVAVFVCRGDQALLHSSTYEIDLSLEIEEAIASGIPVEVKVLNEAPLPFSFQVIRGEAIFCRNEEVLTLYMTGIARRYLEFAPIRRQYLLEAMT